jgi:hypothetical protein
MNEPELGIGINPGMAFNPFPSSILDKKRRDSNPQPLDCESSPLTTCICSIEILALLQFGELRGPHKHSWRATYHPHVRDPCTMVSVSENVSSDIETPEYSGEIYYIFRQAGNNKSAKLPHPNLFVFFLQLCLILRCVINLVRDFLK